MNQLIVAFQRFFRLYAIFSKCSFYIFLVLGLSLSSPTRVRAYSEIFSDEFDSPDTSKWEYLRGNPLDYYSDGYVRTGNSSDNSPFMMQASTNYLEGDVRIEIKFRSLDSTYDQGAGFAFNDSPTYLRTNIEPNGSDLIVNIWPLNTRLNPSDIERIGSTSAICMEGDLSCVNKYTKLYSLDSVEALNWHIFAAEYLRGRYIFYLDGLQVGKSQVVSRPPKYVWIGNPDSSTDKYKYYAKMSFDYIRIYEIPSEEQVPGVNEWYFSQRDQRWARDEYDSASKWSCKETDIEHFGCAMTDAAMILKRYKVNGLDGTEITPGELNAWLKEQPDGYLGNGLTNWLAVARLTKESFSSGKAPHALEFFSVNIESTEQIDGLLAERKLPIINLGGHFVTLYGQSDSNHWLAADPYTGAESSIEKTTPINYLSYYSPSQTDLSYFLITTDPWTRIKLFDQDENEVTLITRQENLKNEANNNMSRMLKQYYLAKPKTGTYRLEKYGPATLYLYGTDGVVKKEVLAGDLQYKINYNPGNIKESEVGRYDTVPPQVIITTPEVDNTRKIEGTASDENGIKRVEIAIQSKKWWAIPFNLWLKVFGKEKWYFPVYFLPNGEYRVRARAFDNYNNVSEVVEKLIKLNAQGAYVRKR